MAASREARQAALDEAVALRDQAVEAGESEEVIALLNAAIEENKDLLESDTDALNDNTGATDLNRASKEDLLALEKKRKEEAEDFDQIMGGLRMEQVNADRRAVEEFKRNHRQKTDAAIQALEDEEAAKEEARQAEKEAEQAAVDEVNQLRDDYLKKRIDARIQFNKDMEGLVEELADRIKEINDQLAEDLDALTKRQEDKRQDIVDRAADKTVENDAKRDKALADAQADFGRDQAKALEDHQRDLADLEADYHNDQAQARREHEANLAKLAREHQRRRQAEVQRHLQKLADIRRQAAQDEADAEIGRQRSIEDIQAGL